MSSVTLMVTFTSCGVGTQRGCREGRRSEGLLWACEGRSGVMMEEKGIKKGDEERE